MATSKARESAATAPTVDMKLEVMAIPVSDIERSKRFYTELGWRLDADFVVGSEFRGLQFTPPGSACSIHFGKGVTAAEPGSARGMFLVVYDIEAARADLIGRDVQVSEIFHRIPGQPAESGRDPQRRSYASFAEFNDPDGNTWLLQEVTQLLPGRADSSGIRFSSTADLANALRRAEAAHGEHEKRTGQRDADWPSWYADYMMKEQAGQALPA